MLSVTMPAFTQFSFISRMDMDHYRAVTAISDGNAFSDTAGSYTVFTHLKQGTGTVDPSTILKTQGGGAKVTNRKTVRQ